MIWALFETSVSSLVNFVELFFSSGMLTSSTEMRFFERLVELVLMGILLWRIAICVFCFRFCTNFQAPFSFVISLVESFGYSKYSKICVKNFKNFTFLTKK